MAASATHDPRSCVVEVTLRIAEEFARDVDEATLTYMLGQEAVAAAKRALPSSKAEVA